jgi:SAM-dependent methyltransferase
MGNGLLNRLTRIVRGVLGRGRRGGGDADSAARFWGEAFEQGGIRTWMAEQRCRFYINESVTGSPHEWPMDWFLRVHCAEPFKLGLSLGCGDGPLERDVRRKGVCGHILGIDISEGALRLAREQAASVGLDGIEYRVGDFNRLDLPRAHYDIVFFHQSLHHVAELEHCLEQVASTLKPGGLLYLDEYVGPSRDAWSDELLADAQLAYQSIPGQLRSAHRIPLPIEEDDPSEAIRSGEISAVLDRFFTVAEQHDYGGNILALLHPAIRWDRLDAPGRDDLLDRLIDEEKRLLANGAQSFYTVILAHPRR